MGDDRPALERLEQPVEEIREWRGVCEVRFAKAVDPNRLGVRHPPRAHQLIARVGEAGLEGEAGKYFTAAYQAKFNHPPRTQGGQYYDGLVVGALAMIAAKSTDPTVYVKSIPEVSTPGPDHTNVYNFADGAKLLAQGKKIKYFGASGPLTFVEPTHTVENSFQAVKVDLSGKTTSVGDISAEDLAKLTAP